MSAQRLTGTRIPQLEIIYKNIRKLEKHRSVKWIDAEIEPSQVLSKMSNDELIVVRGLSQDAKKFAVVILPASSKYFATSASFSKALEKTDISIDDSAEILIVTNGKLSPYQNKNVTAIKNGKKCHIIVTTYSVFMVESPMLAEVPHHQRVGVDVLIKNKINPEYLPAILDADPQSVWRGFVPGDYVRIEKLSGNTGMQYEYRQCVGGSLLANDPENAMEEDDDDA
jgi:DNA-directed RNA polymerase subunit H (RpoH/RPB5)